MLSLPTSPSLLEKMKDRHDPQAWPRFVALYGRLIEGWALRCGARGEEAQDITQEVLLRLVKYLPSYQRGQSRFRAWLHKVTRNVWLDFVNARQKAAPAVGGSDWCAHIHTLPARDELEQCLTDAYLFDMLERALAEAKKLVSQEKWSCFDACALKKVPAPTVAQQLDVPVTTVWKNNQLVKDQLREIFVALKNAEDQA